MRRSLLFFVIVLVVVVVAGLLILMSMGGDEEAEPTSVVEERPTITRQPPTPTPIPNPVVVAVQNIPRGTRLITDTNNTLADYVRVEMNWPVTWVTQEALTSLDQVKGKITRSDIPRGTIILPSMLTDTAGDLSDVGSDAALMIPPDKAAIALPADEISTLGWALRRGDRVDILISLLFVDLDEEFQTALPNETEPIGCISCPPPCECEIIEPKQGRVGRTEVDPYGQPMNVIPGEEEQRPRLASQIVVRDAEVLNVGWWTPVEDVVQLYKAIEAEKAAEAGEQPEGEGEQAPEPTPTPEPGEEVGPEPLFVIEDQQALESMLEAVMTRRELEPLILVMDYQDTLVVKWAGEAGAAFHVVLRSHQDADVRLVDTEAVTLQYMMDRFRIALPSQLPYGLEPAIDSLERAFIKADESLPLPQDEQQ